MNSSSSNLPSQNKTSASVEDYDGELTGSPVSSTNLGDDRGLVMEPIDSADDSANTNSASLSSDNNIVASNHANTTMHQSSSSLSSSTSESNTNDSSNNTSSPAPPASSSTSALPLASSGGPVAFSSAFNSIPSSSIMNNQSAPSTAISEDQDGERDRDGLQIADTTAFINNNNDPSGDIDMNSEGSVTSPTQEAVAEPSVAGVAGLPTADVSASSASPSSTTANETSASSALTQKQRDEEEFPYSIRLTPYIDHSSSTVGNYIPSVERIAKNDMTFRVGRLTDRNETGQIRPEHAPVVFRSKVVSRSHAQLIVQNGEWFVQDVKSSSGTFLNHVRLSPQGTQSPKFPLKDGDVLQLGMDFRGGTEDLYKCIKVRVEVNRSWQRRANTFNIDALGKIKNLYGLTSDELQECVICLNPVAPCQALFISPCSHTWHYKCIRPIIVKSYPHFLCPNCRAVCDLEAEIETPEELRAVMDQQQQQQQQQQQTGQGVSAQEVQQS